MGLFRDIGAPGLIVLILGALLIFGPKDFLNLEKLLEKCSRNLKNQFLK